MTRDLTAIAADIPVPVDMLGRRARAYAAWDKDRGYYAFFACDGGRERADQVGPAFAKPADAARLAALLNGDPPASRPASALAPYRDPRPEAEGDPEPTEAPALAPHLESAAESARSAAGDVPRTTCVACGGALPPGRHGQRRDTCSGRCRTALHRQHAAEGSSPDRDGADRLVTPSRASVPGAEDGRPQQVLPIGRT